MKPQLALLCLNIKWCKPHWIDHRNLPDPKNNCTSRVGATYVFGVIGDNQNRMCKLNSVYCWSRVLLFNTIHTLRWYQTWLPSLYTGCQLLVVIMEPIFSQSLVIWCPGAWTVAHFFMVLQLVSGGDMVMTRVYKFHREKYEIDDNFTTFCKNYYQILLSSMSCT